jgi:hypothetical protein
VRGFGHTVHTAACVREAMDAAAGPSFHLLISDAKVWSCGCWLSPSLQNGPACAGVPARIPGGVAMAT